MRDSIDEYWFLCSLPASQKTSKSGIKYFIEEPTGSDFQLISSSISAAPENTASIEFSRPLSTTSDLTVDLIEDSIYIISISWAVFDGKDVMATSDVGRVRTETLVKKQFND